MTRVRFRDPHPRTRADVLWSAWIGGLAVAGAVMMALTPAAVLHAHPGTALILVLTFMLGALVADAQWNARPWRATATRAATATVGLFALMKFVEGIVTGEGQLSEFGPSRVLRMVLLISLIVLETRTRRSTPVSERAA